MWRQGHPYPAALRALHLEQALVRRNVCETDNCAAASSTTAERALLSDTIDYDLIARLSYLHWRAILMLSSQQGFGPSRAGIRKMAVFFLFLVAMSLNASDQRPIDRRRRSGGVPDEQHPAIAPFDFLFAACSSSKATQPRGTINLKCSYVC